MNGMDPRALPPRLVIDPSLPPDISIQLRSSPHLLRMARTGRQMGSSFNPVLLLVLPALLMMIWAVTDTSGAIVAALGMSLIALLRWMAVDSTNRAAKKRLRLASEYAAHYVLPEDLDHPCQMLLRRAQDAVDAILNSQVNRAGLI